MGARSTLWTQMCSLVRPWQTLAWSMVLPRHTLMTRSPPRSSACSAMAQVSLYNPLSPFNSICCVLVTISHRLCYCLVFFLGADHCCLLLLPTAVLHSPLRQSSLLVWAAWYIARLLVKLTPKGVLFSFLFFSFLFFSFLFFSFLFFLASGRLAFMKKGSSCTSNKVTGLLHGIVMPQWKLTKPTHTPRLIAMTCRRRGQWHREPHDPRRN